MCGYFSLLGVLSQATLYTRVQDLIFPPNYEVQREAEALVKTSVTEKLWKWVRVTEPITSLYFVAAWGGKLVVHKHREEAQPGYV